MNASEKTRGLTRGAALKKYAVVIGTNDAAALRKVLPTRAELMEFYADVKDLAWPGTYGVSPWDFAFSVAHIAAGATVTNQFVLASPEYALAMEYRNAVL